MNLTEENIEFLAKTICGDNGMMPRKKGPNLVDFFARYDSRGRYHGDFTNRRKYTEGKLKSYSNTPVLNQILEDSMNLPQYSGNSISREEAAKIINKHLKKDGYVLQKKQDKYRVVYSKELLIESHNNLSHHYIREQIQVCHTDISSGHLDVAMMNARNLLKSVMAEIIVDRGTEAEYIEGMSEEELYVEVKETLKLNTIDPNISPFRIIQILSGFESVMGGLAGLGFIMEDHPSKLTNKTSWARLVVNSCKTLSDFLLDYRKTR